MKWIALNPSVPIEVQQKAEFMSLQNSSRHGEVFKLISHFCSFKFPKANIFSISQQMIQTCDTTSATIIVSFLLAKNLTCENTMWTFSEEELSILRNQYLSLIIISQITDNVREKYLHIIKSPVLVMHQMLMNCEIQALKLGFDKLEVIYESETLMESRLLTRSFMVSHSIESLQEQIPRYAKLAVKTENFILARNQILKPKLIKLGDDVSESVTNIDNQSLTASMMGDDKASLAGGSSIAVNALLADDGPKSNANDSKCYICNTVFGYLMQRKNKCKICQRFACSRLELLFMSY